MAEERELTPGELEVAAAGQADLAAHERKLTERELVQAAGGVPRPADRKPVTGKDSDDPRLRDAQGADKDKDKDDVGDPRLRDAESAVTWGV